MQSCVIDTDRLTVFYGAQRGVVDLSLEVMRGEVFGFLGPNGAGKTTTMRVLLDIIRPTSGHASVFGLDCQRQGVEIRKRVGYLPGELQAYSGMTGRQYLELVASLRGQRNGAQSDSELCERLDFDPTRRVRDLSSGNKKKLGVIAAFAGTPDLLILDEPTLALDPLLQRSVLDLVREAKSDGRTVFFSSHNLPEVQAVCDRVGIVREGRLVTVDSVEDLTARRFLRLRLSFRRPPPLDAFRISGVTELERQNCSVRLEVHSDIGAVLERAVSLGITDIETQPVTLDEVFKAYFDAREGEDARTGR